MITSFFTFLRAAVVILDSLSGFMEARVVLGFVANTLVKVGNGEKSMGKRRRQGKVKFNRVNFYFLELFSLLKRVEVGIKFIREINFVWILTLSK